MPAKGTRKKKPAPTPSTHIKVSLELHDRLERLGRVNGILNPRTGKGNRTQVIEKLFAQLPVFSQAKIAIEMLLAQHPKAQEYAETVLIKLEDLEIVYEVKKVDTSRINS